MTSPHLSTLLEGPIATKLPEVTLRMATAEDAEFCLRLAEAVDARPGKARFEHPHYQSGLRAGLADGHRAFRTTVTDAPRQADPDRNDWNAAAGAAQFDLLAEIDGERAGFVRVGPPMGLIAQLLQKGYAGTQAAALIVNVSEIVTLAVDDEHTGTHAGSHTGPVTTADLEKVLLSHAVRLSRFTGVVLTFADVPAARVALMHQFGLRRVRPKKEKPGLNLWPVAGKHLIEKGHREVSEGPYVMPTKGNQLCARITPGEGRVAASLRRHNPELG
ncbi:hypothetical protein [Nesterenkonia aerolata]|uniref:N-acetyltransferase domain-containing protein n=1 Tax=Nesterenkonia aerolata TaxID=3074079 RepID=A0ABU2DV89_9MICC|nr:hypothetical protein [Nesterenkonia sp. LY-0111]MDR8020418.1 hypothetical protein [Nesterenkonia sp. LY-0111]